MTKSVRQIRLLNTDPPIPMDVVYDDVSFSFTPASGGDAVQLTPTANPVMSATPDYSVNDAIGTGVITFANIARFAGGVATLTDITLVDRANQKQPIDFLFFNANPAGSTITDNAAFVLADADEPKLVGKISILATDYTTIGAKAVASKINLAKQIKTAAAADIYVALVAQGIINAGTASDFSITLGATRA